MARNKVAEKMKSNAGGEGTPLSPLKVSPRIHNAPLRSPIVKQKRSGLVGIGKIGGHTAKMKK